jgi:hypothetical protein
MKFLNVLKPLSAVLGLRKISFGDESEIPLILAFPAAHFGRRGRLNTYDYCDRLGSEGLETVFLFAKYGAGFYEEVKRTN